METAERRRDDNLLGIAARSAAVVCAVAVTFASLGPASWLPRLLYSNNLEHFAAFYVVALALYAARYRAPAHRVFRDAAIFATVLEVAKLVTPGPRPASFEHWVADLGGILAATAPLVVGAFRRSFTPRALD
jgi:hypothetical protein